MRASLIGNDGIGIVFGRTPTGPVSPMSPTVTSGSAIASVDLNLGDLRRQGIDDPAILVKRAAPWPGRPGAEKGQEPHSRIKAKPLRLCPSRAIGAPRCAVGGTDPLTAVPGCRPARANWRHLGPPAQDRLGCARTNSRSHARPGSGRAPMPEYTSPPVVHACSSNVKVTSSPRRTRPARRRARATREYARRRAGK